MSRVGGRTALLAVVLTAVLVGMIGMKQWTLTTGTPVLLETAPVDPRSLFRGDYVRLNYKISRLDLSKLGGDKDFSAHDTAWVVLEQAQRYWHAVAVYRHRPDAAPGQVIIKGEVRWADGRGSAFAPPVPTRQPRFLVMRYGIESYFVPEGTGRAIERRGAQTPLDILVAVDRFGNAGIKAVELDGREIYRESLF
jgi:uncharacterized membrane-anchored protein